MGLFNFIQKLLGTREKNAANNTVNLVVSLGYEHTATLAEIEAAQEEKALLTQFLEIAIINSGYFKPEKIPQLMDALRDPSYRFAKLNTKASDADNIFLSKEEKLALGLSPRMKYSQEFISYFKESSLKVIEPKNVLDHMQVDAFHRASRRSHLIKFKKMHLIKQVTIQPHDGCKKVNRAKKTYNLDDAPELPLPGCDKLCMCYFEAVFPKEYT